MNFETMSKSLIRQESEKKKKKKRNLHKERLISNLRLQVGLKDVKTLKDELLLPLPPRSSGNETGRRSSGRSSSGSNARSISTSSSPPRRAASAAAAAVAAESSSFPLLQVLEQIEQFFVGWDDLDDDGADVGGGGGGGGGGGSDDEVGSNEDVVDGNGEDDDFPVELIQHALRRCLHQSRKDQGSRGDEENDDGAPPVVDDDTADFRRRVIFKVLLLVKLLVRKSSSQDNVLMNFIPAIFRLLDVSSSTASSSSLGRYDSPRKRRRHAQNHNRSIQKEIFFVLTQIFEQDNDRLVEILDSLELFIRSTSVIAVGSGSYSSSLSSSPSSSGQHGSASSELPADIVKFVVGLLPKVPEQNLWLVVQFLKVSVDDVNSKSHSDADEDVEDGDGDENNDGDDDEDEMTMRVERNKSSEDKHSNAILAKSVVDAIRTELSLLEKTGDIFGMASVASALCLQEEEAMAAASRLGLSKTAEEILRPKQQSLFLTTYLDTIDGTIQEYHVSTIEDDEANDNDQNTSSLSEDGGRSTPHQKISVFDFAVLLLHWNNVTYRYRIQSSLDNVFQQKGCCLPSASKVLEICKDPSVEKMEDSDGGTRDFIEEVDNVKISVLGQLQQSLSGLVLFVLLYPLRKLEYHEPSSLRFVNEAFLSVDWRHQKRIEDCLLTSILNQSMRIHATSIAKTNVDENRQEWASVANNIFRFFGLALEHKAVAMRIFEPLLNLLRDDISCQLLDAKALKELCDLIAKMSRIEPKTRHFDCLLVFQLLLFSPGSLSPVRYDNRESTNRIARGLILGRSIIIYSGLEYNALSSFVRTLTKLLLPQSGRMVDPAGGIYGLEILRCMVDDRAVGKALRDTKPFSIVTSLLSMSKIVQYGDNKNRKPLSPHQVEMRYTDIPIFLESKFKHVRSYRVMAFQFSEFFSCKRDAYVPSGDWLNSCQWVHDLVDMYLSLGRTPKWNPAGWVMGAFEICSLLIARVRTKRKQNGHVDLDFFSFTTTSANYQLDLFRYLTESLDGMKQGAVKKDFVDSSLRFCFSLLLSMALSTAVLKNVDHHFFDETKSKHKPTEEIMFLVQFQILKIFDLKEKINVFERFFRRIAGSTRGPKKRKGPGRPPKSQSQTFQTHVELKKAANQVRHLLDKFFSSTKYIPSGSVWLALTHTSDDAMFVKWMTLSEKDALSKEKLFYAIRLRLYCVRHLRMYAHSDLIINSEKVSKLRVTRSLRFTLMIMQQIRSIQDGSMVFDEDLMAELSNLSCAYLTLMLKVLVASKQSDSDLCFFHCLYISLMQSDDPLEDEIETGPIGSMAKDNFDDLVASFQRYLGSCTVEIDSVLFETLSVFASSYGTEAMSAMIQLSWNNLSSSDFDCTIAKNNAFDSPFASVSALEKYSPGALQDRADGSFEDLVIRDLLLKMSGERYRLGHKHVYMVNALCRHWGLVIARKQHNDVLVDHFRLLVSEIVDYFQSCVGDATDQSGKSNSPTSNRVEDDDDDDGDDEYIPPNEQKKKPNTTRVQFGKKTDFPVLSSSSFPVYYDVILRLVGTTVCIFSVSDHQYTVDNMYKHPVRRLDELLKIFADLSRLHSNYYQYFPKTVHPSIVRTQKTMLNVCIEKVQQFISWRNFQPAITADAVEDGVDDVASTAYLKELVDSIRTHVVEILRVSDSRSLRHRAEQTSAHFGKISKGYGLGQIDLESRPRNAVTATAASVSASATATATSTSTPTDSADMLPPSSIRRKTNHDSNGMNNNQDDNRNSDEEEEDDDLDYDSSDSSFGVKGDWGLQNDDDYSDDQDSSSLVELMVTK